MKISYLIGVHNESKELEFLLGKLYKETERLGDEIILLDDYSDDIKTTDLLDRHRKRNGKVIQHYLNGDFSKHKNFGNSNCSGDYIVNFDADEYPSDVLLENLHELIEVNPQVELYRVPRVNIVRGMIDEDARKWGWKVYSLSEFPGLPIINWEGDYQARIYKNTEKIKWQKPLHETIVGAEFVSVLPLDVDYAIIHDKTIDRQRAQNEFYNKNWSAAANMGRG